MVCIIVFRKHNAVEDPDIRKIRLVVFIYAAYQIISITMGRVGKIRMQYITPGRFHRNRKRPI